MLKRIIAISLAFVFLYDATGYFVTFFILQQQVKNEIRNQIISDIPENQLILITQPVSGSEIQWTGRDEFSFQGQMYDVVRTNVRDGICSYWCINDKMEDKLLSGLDDHVNNHLRDDFKTNSKNHSPVIFDWIILNASGFIYPEISCTKTISEKIVYTDYSNPPPVPPPRYV